MVTREDVEYDPQDNDGFGSVSSDALSAAKEAGTLSGGEFDFSSPPVAGGSGFGSIKSDALARAESQPTALSYTKLPQDYIVPPKPIPTVQDMSPFIVEGLERIDAAAGPVSVWNEIRKSTTDLLQQPEWLSFLVDFYKDAQNPLTEYGGFSKDHLSSTEAAIRWGTVEGVTNALYAQTQDLGWEPVLGSVEGQQNVSTLFAENDFRPEVKDLIAAFVGGVPNENRQFGEEQTQRDSVGGLSNIGNITAIAFGEAAEDPNNYREQYAADLTEYLRGSPIVDSDSERQFIITAWQKAEQVLSERQGRESHLGAIAGPLDRPRHVSVRAANKLFNQMVFPDDQLNRVEIPLGENVMYSMGFHQTDERGTSVLNTTWGKPFAEVLKHSINVVPVVGAYSAIRATTGDERGLVGTPFVSDFIDELQAGNNFYLGSGAIDFTASIALDPITYAAGAGFGWKATKTIPRAANVTKGQAMLQALTPFYGAHATGVRWGVTSRVVYAAGSRTWDEMVDAARYSTKGNEVFELARTVDSAERFMRLVPSLNNNPVAQILVEMAHRGDEDLFWESIRAFGHGANDSIQHQAKYDALRGLVNSGKRDLQTAAQDALNTGKLQIQDVLRGELGFRAQDEIYEVATSAGGTPFDNESIALTVRAPSRVAAETGNVVFDNENGIEVYASIVDGVEAFGVKVDGEVVGGATFRQGGNGGAVGLDKAARAANKSGRGRYDAGDALADALGPEGLRTLARDDTISPAGGRWLERQFNRLGIGDEIPEGGFGEAVNYGVEVLRPSAGGDGQRIIINTSVGRDRDVEGWRVTKLTGDDLTAIESRDRDNLLRWMQEAGYEDLALKIETFGSRELAGAPQSVLAFTEDELLALKRFADNTDADAVAIGKELIVGRSSQSKLLRGEYSEAGQFDLGTGLARGIGANEVLGDNLSRAAHSYFLEQTLNGAAHREVVLVNRMPVIKSSAMAAENVAKWTGLSGSSRVAQFARRTAAGLRHMPPTEIDFVNMRQGGADLRKTMELLGARREVIDDILGQWWATDVTDSQRRRRLIAEAFEAVGEDINDPHMKLGLMSWPTRGGAQSFTMKGSEEIGQGLDKGRDVVVPTMRAHYQTSIPMPDLVGLNRQVIRNRKAKRLPRFVVDGFGKTNTKRKDLADAYKRDLIERRGIKAWQDLGPDENAREKALMTVAYADVLGFKGRANGLGQVNFYASKAGGVYKFFHNTFTIAQLAFRPFAWASRVNLEEHARAWMMGYPTIIRRPLDYGFSFYDKHLIQRSGAVLEKQRIAADASAVDLFGGQRQVDEALSIADEMIPGWSQKVRKKGIADDAAALRTQWSHDLTRALNPGRGQVASRGNLSRSVMWRDAKVKRAEANLSRRYGIEYGDFDWKSDVPEMVNKSNTFLLADEMVSSIKNLTFQRNIRRADINTYGHAYAKKGAQVVNDYAGRYAINRALQKLTGTGEQYSAEAFARTQYWRDMRENIRMVADKRGQNAARAHLRNLDDVELARFYLDEIMIEDNLGGLLGGLWREGGDTEKVRILSDLAHTKRTTVTVGGSTFNLDFRSNQYANAKAEFARMFQAQADVENFNFPTVAGMFHPLYADTTWKNPFRKFTNQMLQTFGEDASQNLHRRPAYLAERRRVRDIYMRMGWAPEDANYIAHNKAFEAVNYTFFNNQHTGILLHRMNKAIPFFSAWAEVISTWAWKIPSQNYLPLGYARMVHRMDQVMQGFVKMGMVDISDNGQWYLNLEAAPDQESPYGRGLSRAMNSMVSTPINVIEHFANIAREVSNLDTDNYDPVDFSAWKKDNYQIAIGSPVEVNSHGVMGVNQFQFGLNPAASFATAWAGNKIWERLPFAVDTELVEAATLAEAYEQLDPDISIGEFLALNEEILREEIGDARYNSLFVDGREFTPPESIDISGIALQVPGSSWMDGMVGDLFYPYGAVETLPGIIREVVPSTLSYMMRGLGVFIDDNSMVEGIVNVITGPMEQHQIDGQIVEALVHLEASEGLITKANRIQVRLEQELREAGAGTPEELYERSGTDSPESKRIAELEARLRSLNDMTIKRATDIAAGSVFARGLMGFLMPATPRTFHDELKVRGQFWGGRNVAEASKARGGLSFTEAMLDVNVADADDMARFLGSVDGWLQNERGGEAKEWFRATYPGLVAWTNPTTYWGPAGPPASQRDLDKSFDDIASGNRAALPPDVFMFKNAAAAIDGSFEAELRVASGATTKEAQAAWALNNWKEYSDLRDERRQKYNGLEWWDSELNGGNYIEWRERNNDGIVLFDTFMEQMYELQTAGDEILALMDLADITDDAELRKVEGLINSSMSEYMNLLRQFEDDLKGQPEYSDPLDEIVANYFSQVVSPYYTARGEEFAKLQDAESSADRSLVFENVRQIENAEFQNQPTIMVDGREVRVPNELERAWGLLEPEEQEAKVMRWIGRPAEWLSDFAVSKMIERTPHIEDFLPTRDQARWIIEESTENKNEIRAFSKQNPEQMSEYERTQALNKVDEWRQTELINIGESPVVQWENAWPIERLSLSGLLPPALTEIGGFYSNVRAHLEAQEPPKGPTSDLGRTYFISLTDHLEGVYYNQHPEAKLALEKLGEEMFGEDGRYAIYARLYGSYYGELD